ncbi:MAG: glycosyltransferase [Bacteroidales bacterium]
MTPKILLTIVLYNEKLANSVSYQSIKLAAERFKFDYTFYVHNNSPQAQPISEANVHYVHSPENVGLSKAYNNAAKYAKANGFEYLLLLDQDTLWNEDFFEKLSIAIEQNPTINLFAPIVLLKKNNARFSPKRLILTRTFNTTITQGIYPVNKYLIVNSGICIKLDAFFSCGGYDEAVYLDYADVRFIEKFAKHYNHFYLFNSIAYQDFSNDETDAQKLFNRFCIYLDCLLHYPKTSIIVKLAFLYTIFRHTLALTLRTREFRFIKMFFTHYLFK